MSTAQLWLYIGFFGQFLFSMRFIVQWIASEQAKKSIIPKAFWYFSISGGITLLSYAIYKQDPVFILGQSMGLLVYARNLYFLSQTKNSADNTDDNCKVSTNRASEKTTKDDLANDKGENNNK